MRIRYAQDAYKMRTRCPMICHGNQYPNFLFGSVLLYFNNFQYVDSQVMEHLYRRVSAYGTKARARSVRDLSSDAFRERTRLAMREIASQLLDHNWSGAPLVSSITRNHGGGSGHAGSVSSVAPILCLPEFLVKPAGTTIASGT